MPPPLFGQPTLPTAFAQPLACPSASLVPTLLPPGIMSTAPSPLCPCSPSPHLYEQHAELWTLARSNPFGVLFPTCPSWLTLTCPVRLIWLLIWGATPGSSPLLPCSVRWPSAKVPVPALSPQVELLARCPLVLSYMTFLPLDWGPLKIRPVFLHFGLCNFSQFLLHNSNILF